MRYTKVYGHGDSRSFLCVKNIYKDDGLFKELVLEIIMLSVTFITNNVQRDVMIKNDKLLESLTKKTLPLTGNLVGITNELVKFRDLSDDMRLSAKEFLNSIEGREIIDLKNFIVLAVANRMTAYHHGAACMLLGLAKRYCTDVNFDNVREVLVQADQIVESTDDVLVLKSLSCQAIVREGKMSGSVSLLGKYSLRSLSSKKTCGMSVIRSVKSSVSDSQEMTSHEDYIIKSALVNIGLIKKSFDDTRSDKVVFSNTQLIPVVYSKLVMFLKDATSAEIIGNRGNES